MNASGCGVTVKDYGHLLAARPGLRRQGAPHQRADARPERAAARHGAGAEAGLRRAAARPARGWPSIRPARCSTASSCAAASSSTCARSASTSSWRPATATCAAARPAPTACCSPSWPPAARPQARPPGRWSAGHRLGQHRLHPAPAERHHARRCGTGSRCWTRRWRKLHHRRQLDRGGAGMGLQVGEDAPIDLVERRFRHAHLLMVVEYARFLHR
jgi:hypothetical protein